MIPSAAARSRRYAKRCARLRSGAASRRTESERFFKLSPVTPAAQAIPPPAAGGSPPSSTRLVHADQHVLQRLHLLQAAPGTERNAVQRIVRHRQDRKSVV